MKTPKKNKDLPTELDELLNDLSENEVAGLNEVWEASDQIEQAQPDEAALANLWSNIESELDEAKPATIHALNKSDLNESTPHEPTQNRPKPQLVPLRWMAVAATILFGAFGLSYYVAPVSVTAPFGETASVVLHDGSEVELNSGSTIRYNKWFGDERRIALTGEAYFDVVKGQKPFIVETFNGSVTVLGTRFNVRAWEGLESENTRVSLQSGSVLLERNAGDENPGQDETLTLSPGQTGVVNGASVALIDSDTVQVKSALAWREGNFFFSNESLGSIMADVERRYNTDVRFTPGFLSNRRLKFAMEKPQSAEAIVNDITETLGLKYRETSVGYEIFDPN